MFGDPLLRSQAYTAASYATWNGGTAAWTYLGTNWTAGGSAFTWNNLGTGASFNTAAPLSPIPISGVVYTYGVTTNVDGYSFNATSSDLLELLGGGIVANGNTTINCPILVGDNQSWTVAAGKSLTVSNVLHLTYNDLTISGAGTTILSGTIDFGDVLGIVGDGRMGNLIHAGSGPVYLTGMTNFSGNITAQTGAGKLYIAPPGGGAVTWDGALFGSGTIGLVKTGTGTQTLVGASISYSGGTTVSQGKLVLQDTPAFVNNITNYATLELNATSAALTFTMPISGSGTVNMTGSNVLTIAGSVGNTYTGATNSTISVDLKKSTGYAIPGNLNVSSPNGAIYVRQLADNQIVPSAVVNFNGGYWPCVELLGHSLTLAGISDPFGTGVIENSQDETAISNNSVLTINNATDYSFSGYLRDGNFGGNTGKLSLVKNGVGTLVLAGANAGGYSGVLTVNAGTLDYSGATLPNCNYTITGGTLNIGGQSHVIGTFQVTGGTVTGTGTLTSNTACDIQAGTVSANLAGTNIGLNKTGSGTAILTNNNTYTGTTTISGGILQLGTGSTTGTAGNYTNIVINANGTLNVNRSNNFTYAGRISGTGTLIQDGSNTLTLAGNSFSGNLIVNKGTLTYSGTSTLPSGNYTTTGGTLSLGARSQSIGTFRITGGTVSGSGTLTSNAAYDIQAGTVGPILAGNVGLDKTGPGLATISSSPTYNGATNVQAGTLTFSAGLPGGNYAISGGTLSIGSLSKLIGAFQITGGTVSGTGTLTSNSAYDIQAGTIAVALVGNVGLHKTQNGPALLTAANSYSGPTMIDDGVLALSGNGQISLASPVTNNALLLIADGEHTLSAIAGNGSTLIGNSAQLTVSSIDQDALTIGGDYISLLTPLHCSGSESIPAVPEPTALSLLGSFGLACVAYNHRKRRMLHFFRVIEN